MRSTILLAVACLLAVLAACGPPNRRTDASQDEVPLGQLPDTAEPKHYRLDLTIEPDKPRFSGIVEIDVALKEPARVIYLHGRELTVEQLTARLTDGTTVTGTYEQVHDTGVAKLTFENELPKGEATLRFVYNAAFESTPDALTSMTDSGEKYAWTQFQEISARRAFPGFTSPGSKHRSTSQSRPARPTPLSPTHTRSRKKRLRTVSRKRRSPRRSRCRPISLR